MLRTLTISAIALVAATFAASSNASEIRGSYLETRTCQVYTGPCFANGEVGLTGKDAIMAWNIDTGQYNGVDLSGLSVVVVVNASDTLGFQGLNDAQQVRSVILVDEKAQGAQREALIEFARAQAGRAGESVARIDTAPIEMSLDLAELRGELKAGEEVKLSARKANPDDCICSNESAYYPPLAEVKHFVPGVAMEGEFRGRGLGSRWSTPEARSAYLATFSF